MAESAGLRAVLFTVGGYFLTLLLAALLCGGVMIALSPHGCAALSRALLALWASMAFAACLGILIVGLLVWRLALPVLARLGIVAAFSLALLGTLVVIAFGLMIAFNC